MQLCLYFLEVKYMILKVRRKGYSYIGCLNWWGDICVKIDM